MIRRIDFEIKTAHIFFWKSFDKRHAVWYFLFATKLDSKTILFPADGLWYSDESTVICLIMYIDMPVTVMLLKFDQVYVEINN